MYRKLFIVGAVLAALFAVYASWPKTTTPLPEPIIGRNGTVLFVTSAEHGLSNVHMATASALLEQHPDIEVHFASFPKLASRLERISDYAQRKVPSTRRINFHPLNSGLSYFDAVIAGFGAGLSTKDIFMGPGLKGIDSLCKSLQHAIAPWSAEDHFALFTEIGPIIEEIDPALVVLDTIFNPGIEATRTKHRLHAFISPNQLVDQFPGEQPWAGIFWKYPAMGSGFPFPVPLKLIPTNIYLTLRIIGSIISMPELSAKKEYLKERGINDAIAFYGLYRDDTPWISQTMHEASTPLEVVPANVTCTGPIVLSLAPAVEQDPKMVAWLKQAPTVLVNLGSFVIFSEDMATTFVQAMVQLMEKTDLQFLWKFRKEGEYSDDFLIPAQKYIQTGRLRISNWLTVDPTALLETGHIVASIHHGGANCFYEAIYAGVPQIVLPLWVDLFNYAQLMEQTGVGRWACRETSPEWTVECLSSAIQEVAVTETTSNAMKATAKKLSAIAKQEPGKDIAARKIAELARSGR